MPGVFEPFPYPPDTWSSNFDLKDIKKFLFLFCWTRIRPFINWRYFSSCSAFLSIFTIFSEFPFLRSWLAGIIDIIINPGQRTACEVTTLHPEIFSLIVTGVSFLATQLNGVVLFPYLHLKLHFWIAIMMFIKYSGMQCWCAVRDPSFWKFPFWGIPQFGNFHFEGSLILGILGQVRNKQFFLEV